MDIDSLGSLFLEPGPEATRRGRPSVQCPIKMPPGALFVNDTNEMLDHHDGYGLRPGVDQHLKTGDYSIITPKGKSLEDSVVVERKSMNDILGCCSSSRDRWEACLERLAVIEKPLVVVEADFRALARGNYRHTAIKPQSVIGSIMAWMLRYRVSFFFAGTHANACELTRWWLLRGLQDELQKPKP